MQFSSRNLITVSLTVMSTISGDLSVTVLDSLSKYEAVIQCFDADLIPLLLVGLQHFIVCCL